MTLKNTLLWLKKQIVPPLRYNSTAPDHEMCFIFIHKPLLWGGLDNYIKFILKTLFQKQIQSCSTATIKAASIYISPGRKYFMCLLHKSITSLLIKKEQFQFILINKKPAGYFLTDQSDSAAHGNVWRFVLQSSTSSLDVGSACSSKMHI